MHSVLIHPRNVVMTEGRSFGPLLPSLDSFWALWCQHYRLEAVPYERVLDSASFQPWQNHLALIAIEDRGALKFRRCGPALIRRFGRDASGALVEDLAPDIAEELSQTLWRCVRLSAPMAAHTRIPLGRLYAEHTDLVLPFADADGRITTLLFASYEVYDPPPAKKD